MRTVVAAASCAALLLLLAIIATSVAAQPSLPLADTPFEQVFSDRYLFSQNSAECTSWTSLPISNLLSVQAPPFYHIEAYKGAWMLAVPDSATGNQTQLYWFDVSSGSLTALSELSSRTCTLLVTPTTTSTFAGTFTFAAMCGDEALIFLVDPNDPTKLQQVYSWQILSEVGTVNAAMIVNGGAPEGTIYIGSSTGLYSMDIQTGSMTMNLNGINEAITALTQCADYSTIFAGAATHLYMYDFQDQIWRQEEVTALIDSPITSLAWDSTNTKVWIGQSDALTSLSPITLPDGQTHWIFGRVAGHVSNPGGDIGGLPFANLTAVVFPLTQSGSGRSDGRVWFGSQRGVMRYDSQAADSRNTWRLFNSGRYMPQRDAWVNVSSMTVLAGDPSSTAGNTVIAVTAKGFAVIRFEMYTLAQKAAYLQTYMDPTNLRHLRYGLAGGCTIESGEWGNNSTCKKHDDDNDGLWTSIYLASQVFRYAVTKDPAVQASAWESFKGMEFQQIATGIYGYPARSLIKKGDQPTPDPEHWHTSPVDSSWWFKGDTSSDEISGHEFIYPLVQQLLANSSAQQLEAQLTYLNITNTILDNDWYLIGEHHNHTTWGVWNPSYINDNELWQEGRGPNSLQILSWLVSSYANTGNQSYLDGINELCSAANRYDINLLNAKMIAVCDSNFSDDELNFLSYFNFQHGLDQAVARLTKLSTKKHSAKRANKILGDFSNLAAYMEVGLEQAMKYKSKEFSPFYNSIYCYTSGQVGQSKNTHKILKQHLAAKNKHAKLSTPGFSCAQLSQDSVWYLTRWPMEQLTWPQFNSDRLDIEINWPANGCRDGLQSLNPLPYDERDVHKWNDGPYDLDGGDGFYEEGAGPFLSGYWMMRYYGMLD